MNGTLRKTLMAAILSCAVSIVGCGNNQELTFHTVEKSSTSSPVEQGIHVMRSNTEWAAFWSSIKTNLSPPPPLPAVDFSSDAVIAVFDVVRPTGGYSITVTKVMGRADGYTIEAVQQSPGTSCQVSQIIEQPYQIVTARAFSGGASLIVTPTILECSAP